MPRITDREIELLDAAVVYCAVADWFESPSVYTGHDARAEAFFDRVEAQLRSAGCRVLTDRAYRLAILRSVGIRTSFRQGAAA